MENPFARLKATSPDVISALRAVPGRVSDVAEIGRGFAQGIGSEILGGLSGAGTLMLTGDPGKAAENTRGVSEKYAYDYQRPGAQEILGNAGEGLNQFSQVADTPIGRKTTEAWEGLTNASPFLGATIAAVANVAGPGGNEKKLADEARKQALKAVRETVTPGPVFRSAVEEAVAKLPPKATAGQYVATLRNMPGIKGEELADLGLHTMDPTHVMDREGFLRSIQGRRNERTQKRISFSDMDPAALAQKVNEMTQSRVEAASSNPDTYNELGLDKILGEHPEYATVAANKNSEPEFRRFVDAHAGDAFGDALDIYMNDVTEHGTVGANEQLRQFINGDEAAAERVNAMAEELISAARRHESIFKRLFGDELGGLSWQEINYRYGGRTGTDKKVQQALQQKIASDPAVVEHIRAQTEAEIMRDPGQFHWGTGTDRPRYAGMRYYGQEQPSAGYAEITEAQTPLPWHPDQRAVSEPHWPMAEGGRANNITQHLRVDDVRTPEGDPALMLNELQSKYAADAEGFTTDPLTVETASDLAFKDVGAAQKWIEGGGNADDLYTLENRFSPENMDTIEELSRDFNNGDIDAEELTDLLNEVMAEQEHMYASGPDEVAIAHRGEAFGPGHGRSWPDTEEGRLQAQAVIDRLQRGERLPPPNPERDTELARYINEMPKKPFERDPRASPRAGVKSWRLRGLKMALREAADRGMNDLYLPKGRQIPRIENWEGVGTGGGYYEPKLKATDTMTTRDAQDQGIAAHLSFNENDFSSYGPIMKNYEERLPKEIEKYLKKFGAKIEEDKMLPTTGEKTHAATGKRIKFTPELLAEILRGQELYKILGGTGLVGLVAGQQGEEPQL